MGALTSLLLLEGHLIPIDLHPISQGHPEIGLLLGRHALPSLLDVGEGGIADRMRLPRLLMARCLLRRLAAGRERSERCSMASRSRPGCRAQLPEQRG